MIRYIFIILLTINISNAREYFINAALGSDTTASFDASTPKNAFKTISKAIANVNLGDEIIIEGTNGKDRLTYKENIIIPKDKPFIIIRGNNFPIITSNNDKENTGILVLNSDIRIEGIEFDGFLDGKIGSLNIEGGAGVAIKNGNRDSDIRNCKFTNCNYGIIANENQSVRFDQNLFNQIKKLDDKDFNGGIGILILSGGKYIQDNHIGAKSGNTFSEIDNYGILIGTTDESKLVLGDYSKISNNTFNLMKGTGIGIFNLEGIMDVSNNTFGKCNTSIEIRGESIDAIISNNTFMGGSGDFEIVTNERYPGELLYSIWKGNNNTFHSKLKALSEANDDNIKPINGKRFITTNEDIIKKNFNNQGKILE